MNLGLNLKSTLSNKTKIIIMANLKTKNNETKLLQKTTKLWKFSDAFLNLGDVWEEGKDSD
jgi:hypothetical protein